MTGFCNNTVGPFRTVLEKPTGKAQHPRELNVKAYSNENLSLGSWFLGTVLTTTARAN